MSPNPLIDFRVSLLPYAPRPAGTTFGSTQAVDLTSRFLLDRAPSVNRSIERDLLSFRTGDVTIGLDNQDGFLDDLFSILGPTDRWHLRITRGSQTVFVGVVLGLGSITFDRFENLCEVTAYGPTRILKDTSVDAVRRTFPAYTVGTATAGQSTITLGAGQSASPLTNGDTIHLNDKINKEDPVIIFATSAVPGVITLAAPLSNTYPAGTEIRVETPFYRYKTMKFLVEEVFKAAGVPMLEYRLSEERFSLPAPSGVSLYDLPANLWPHGCFVCLRNGKPHVMLGSNVATNRGVYSQASADSGWTLVDTTHKSFVDWTIYRKVSDGEPTTPLYHLRDAHAEAETLQRFGVHESVTGFKYAATSTLFQSFMTAGSIFFAYRTTTDGINWSAVTTPFTIGSYTIDTSIHVVDCEYDPGRDEVWTTWSTDGGKQMRRHNTAGTTLQTFSNVETLFGLRYVPEWDAIVGLKNGKTSWVDNLRGPWKIVAYRGATKLWERDLTTFAVDAVLFEENATFRFPPMYPTKTLRVYNGVAHMMMVSDVKLVGIISEDEFVTTVEGVIRPNATRLWYAAGWDGTGYRAIGFNGNKPNAYTTWNRFFNGIIDYADFEDQSAADALTELASLVNAVAWIDDDLQGHFVSRDLAALGDPGDINDLVQTKDDTRLWDQSKQFVEIRSGDIRGIAGTKDFVAEGLILESPYVPNEFYANILAAAYHEFFSEQRGHSEVRIRDDGRIYFPLDRVRIDGQRYLVYESDHDLTEMAHELKLIEDV